MVDNLRPGDETGPASNEPARSRDVRDANDVEIAPIAVDADLIAGRTAEALRASEERYRLLLDNMLEGCQLIAFDWRYLYINDAAARHNEHPQAEMLGRTMMEVWPGIEASPVFALLRRSMEQRVAAFEEIPFAYPDGRQRWFAVRSQPTPEGIFALSIDVTEQRQLEDQLRQSQKMESVGRLAGGIAHDFNNLLTVINGLADLMISNLRDRDPLRADLEQIRHAGDRAAALTRQLLALSRQQILKLEVINLNAVVEDMHPMLQRLIGEDVDLVFSPSEPLGSVKADPGQIEQVILNLVNARDAMPDGGRLTIETRDVGPDGSHPPADGSTRPGPRVMLSVSDTGVGMDEATRDTGVRALFHDQGAWKRDRPRPRDGLRDRQAERRERLGLQRAR